MQNNKSIYNYYTFSLYLHFRSLLRFHRYFKEIWIKLNKEIMCTNKHIYTHACTHARTHARTYIEHIDVMPHTKRMEDPK